MKKNISKIEISKNQGALLLELLIAISLLAVVLAVAVNGVFLSMQSNKISGERDIANALATESLEAVRSITEENWANIYGLTKTTQHYYPIQSAGAWTLVPGDEIVTLNGVAYTRYITVTDVSRDSITRNIEPVYILADDDPSTQQVTVSVTWNTGSPATVTLSNYYFRWKNLVCAQTGWTTGGTGKTVEPCSATTYDTIDPTINVTGGLHLQ